MKNAATAAARYLHPSQNLSQSPDYHAVANLYAAQLQLCFQHGSTTYSLAPAIHAHMITFGFKPRGHILNRLIYFYCKSFNFIHAKRLFDKIPQPDVVARTTLISAYSASGDPKFARDIFDKTPLRIRDTVCFNAMITGYSHNNDGHAAIQIFNEMRRKGFEPDNFTYTSVLGALALIADHEKHCQQFHSAVAKSGTLWLTSVVNALISVYVKCASSPLASSSLLMSSARKLFNEMPVKDELSWTTIITGKMHSLGIKHDEFTYTNVLSACADAGFFLHGKQVHAYIIRTESNSIREFPVSVNNALITLYWKCGKIDQAKTIFDNILGKDLVSWNAILSAFVSAGRITEAKSFFNEMPNKMAHRKHHLDNHCCEKSLKIEEEKRDFSLFLWNENTT
ncbi:unnamed protein product [Fraxinus pennsylvanica]|uniref:Pentatricopeptide repeat-containing protein n=1 Tax=Fraxinus pennsylvanica TaxID=56036 RepID=A0AAD2E1N3_9LAMI|nr:unnamed protein product [Fraxinus pennsylvanica]